jgi:pimeloyl-ACP methyl ester carboxylesterase
MSSKPTFVFVHGSGHHAETWDKVATLLEAQGYKCIKTALPSNNGTPDFGFPDDVKAVQADIQSETSQGHDVVIVAHSYGGQVGNSSIKSFSKADAPSARGHVIGIVLIASGHTIAGMAFLEPLGGVPPPAFKLNKETGMVDLACDPRETFYHDLPPEERDEWTSKITGQSLKALTEGGEVSYAGWKDVPNWYLSTTEDRALPLAMQQYSVSVAREQGADVTVRELPTSHSPMLSKPNETAAILKEASEDFVAKKGH